MGIRQDPGSPNLMREITKPPVGGKALSDARWKDRRPPCLSEPVSVSLETMPVGIVCHGVICLTTLDLADRPKPRNERYGISVLKSAPFGAGKRCCNASYKLGQPSLPAWSACLFDDNLTHC